MINLRVLIWNDYLGRTLNATTCIVLGERSDVDTTKEESLVRKIEGGRVGGKKPLDHFEASGKKSLSPGIQL